MTSKDRKKDRLKPKAFPQLMTLGSYSTAVVLPKTDLQRLGWQAGDPVEFQLDSDNNRLILKKPVLREGEEESSAESSSLSSWRETTDEKTPPPKRSLDW